MLLESIWFYIWGLLWAVYFMTDGFDLGVGMLLPILGRDDTRRRMMYHATGSLWDGNEVWLLTAGGVTFAAFPKVYATMFSALYSPLMLILFALIIRGVSFEFRNKVDNPSWRKLWDGCMTVGSFLPALLLGVAFANIFRGLPMDEQGYHGTIISLLNPYGLLGGVLFVLLFLVHGALWICIRCEGTLQEQAHTLAGRIWIALLAIAVIFLGYSRVETTLYDNYIAYPLLFLCIAVTVGALLTTRVMLAKKKYWYAWGASALTIVGATFFGVIGLYPNMFPSRTIQAASLTAHNSSSTPMTLTIMLVVSAIFVPLVIAYQAYTYYLFSGKVTEADLAEEEAY